MSLVPFRRDSFKVSEAPSAQLISRIGLSPDRVPERMVALLETARNEQVEQSKAIHEHLRLYTQRSEEVFHPLDGLVDRVVKDLSEGGLSEQSASLARTMCQVTRAVMQFQQETVDQYLALQAKGRQIFTDDTYRILSLALHARTVEMEQFQQELALCYKQEDHQLAYVLQEHAMMMQKETQAFDQLFEIRSLNEDARIQEVKFDQSKQEEEKAHHERLQRLNREEDALREAHRARLQGMKDQADSQKQHIEAEARVQIASILASEKRR